MKSAISLAELLVKFISTEWQYRALTEWTKWNQAINEKEKKIVTLSEKKGCPTFLKKDLLKSQTITAISWFALNIAVNQTNQSADNVYYCNYLYLKYIEETTSCDSFSG
uniref:Uncharacterized protein n=1 Tax=Cacopsylla melanoneura TaxID=428564 RepID=A0A8D8RXA2_9HEMI